MSTGFVLMCRRCLKGFDFFQKREKRASLLWGRDNGVLHFLLAQGGEFEAYLWKRIFGIEWQVFSKRLVSCRHCAPVFIASRSVVPGYVCFFLHAFSVSACSILRSLSRLAGWLFCIVRQALCWKYASVAESRVAITTCHICPTKQFSSQLKACFGVEGKNNQWR